MINIKKNNINLKDFLDKIYNINSIISLNEQIINKTFSLKTNEGGGLYIMNDLVIYYENAEKISKTKVFKTMLNDIFPPQIGVPGTDYVTYFKGTNLLTCPFFMLKNKNDIGFGSSLETYSGDTVIFERKMVLRTNCKIIYEYFDSLDTVYHVDTSCEKLESIRADLYSEENIEHLTKLQTSHRSGLRGGGKTKKRKPTKNKTKQNSLD